jgi:hypothetical protein
VGIEALVLRGVVGLDGVQERGVTELGRRSAEDVDLPSLPVAAARNARAVGILAAWLPRVRRWRVDADAMHRRLGEVESADLVDPAMVSPDRNGVR